MDLEKRVERLEQENRRLKVAGGVLVGGSSWPDNCAGRARSAGGVPPRGRDTLRAWGVWIYEWQSSVNRPLPIP